MTRRRVLLSVLAIASVAGFGLGTVWAVRQYSSVSTPVPGMRELFARIDGVEIPCERLVARMPGGKRNWWSEDAVRLVSWRYRSGREDYEIGGRIEECCACRNGQHGSCDGFVVLASFPRARDLTSFECRCDMGEHTSQGDEPRW